MKIVDVKAYPTSYRVPKELQVSLGIGTMTKRDCVMVKVTTEDGIVGWGESHHARSPGSIGHLINTTLKGFVVGMDATDTVGIWAKIYKFQLGSHGMGAATSMAMSGLGLRSAHHVVPAAFWASWAESLSIINQRHPDLASHIVNSLEHPSEGMSKSLHELMHSDDILRGDGFQHQGTWTDFLEGCRIEREVGDAQQSEGRDSWSQSGALFEELKG